jgi:hypothetical protein
VNLDERRYNDRDVRDNREVLEEVAVEYLEQYTGGFDFLVDMRMRVATGYGLTTAMVRGVLNCMRNDPRVVGMPEPGHDYHEPDADVIPMRPRRRRERPEPTPPEVCPDLGTEHDAHWFPCQRASGEQHCLGWHAVNRGLLTVRARFHAPYVRGRQSNLVHRATGEGEVTWFPERFHQYGPSYPARWRVGVACPLPWLVEPTLLDAAGVRAAEPYDAPTSRKYKEVTLCPRCFPGSEGAPL